MRHKEFVDVFFYDLVNTVSTMSEVIDLLCDSSVDEQHEEQPTSSTVKSSGPQIISLLDDDDEDDDVRTGNTLPRVSLESSMEIQKSKRRKTDLSDNTSDSDDSYSFLNSLKESGLSRKKKTSSTAIHEQIASVTNTNGESLASTTVEATMSLATVPPSEAIDDIETPSNSERSKRPVNNPYAKTKKVTLSNVTPAAASIRDLSNSVPNLRKLDHNPYTSKKKNLPSPLVTVGTISLTTSNAKMYPDLRAQISLCLWKYARTLTRQSHNRQKLDQTMKKINAIAVAEYPIRSLEEYVVRFLGRAGATGAARDFLNELREQLNVGGWSTFDTPVNANIGGKYFTITEACLVACYSKVQRSTANSNNSNREDLAALLSGKDCWISLAWLLPEIQKRLHPSCPSKIVRESDSDSGEKFYTLPSTISAEFSQIRKLSSEPLVFLKRHTIKGQQWFELTPLGYKTAKRLKDRVYPAPPGRYRVSNQVDKSKYSDIVLGMDLREGGGGHKVLHSMCNKLDMTKLPYVVLSLDIGDYVFYHKNKLLPVIIERKSVQDVAMSIHDGRWTRQKQRMYHGQYVFGYESARCFFIIEGKQEKHQVTGGFIGNTAYQVTLERLNSEIKDLESEGFDVVRTTSPENSMLELSRWAQRVVKQVRSGEMTARYTYQEFKDEVKKIPKETDFSRLAKYYAHEQKKKAESNNHNETVILLDDGSDDENDSCTLKDNLKRRLTYSESTTTAAHQDSKPKAVVGSAIGTSSSLKSFCDSKPKVDYSNWSVAALKDECIKHGLAKSGSRADLILRLNGPWPPKIWLKRKEKGEYVPNGHDTGGCAILVAMLLLHQEEPHTIDFSKDEIYVKAESLKITKNPFSGGTTQTGPYHYDGWSSMKNLLQGDPALVVKKKNRFRLTKSCDISGYPLAEAMHKWCHDHNNCSCQDLL